MSYSTESRNRPKSAIESLEKRAFDLQYEPLEGLAIGELSIYINRQNAAIRAIPPAFNLFHRHNDSALKHYIPFATDTTPNVGDFFSFILAESHNNSLQAKEGWTDPNSLKTCVEIELQLAGFVASVRALADAYERNQPLDQIERNHHIDNIKKGHAILEALGDRYRESSLKIEEKYNNTIKSEAKNHWHAQSPLTSDHEQALHNAIVAHDVLCAMARKTEALATPLIDAALGRGR